MSVDDHWNTRRDTDHRPVQERLFWDFTMKTLRACRSGAIAVMTALTLPLLLGFGSLGVEVGHWYLSQRQMQGAADAAAISAAAQYIADVNNNNPASTAYQTVGQSFAGLNGFTIPIANTCLIPTSGGD